MRRGIQLLFAAIPANDRHRTAQQGQRTRCLTGVDLRRRYKAVTVRRFVIVRLVGTVFGPSATPSGLDVLISMYAFAFQIYGDFAGYSNIARGLSKLMGIELNIKGSGRRNVIASARGATHQAPATPGERT